MATLLALSVGLTLFGHCHVLVTSVQWFSVGVVSAVIFYYGHTYTAFFGGVLLAVYAMSLWPLLLKRAVQFPPHQVFAIMVSIYFSYILLSVWVVAYNFVPGGVFTRERTDVMLGLVVACCGMGTCDLGYYQSVHGDRTVEAKQTKTVNYIGQVFRRLSTILEEEAEECRSNHQVSTKLFK